MLSLGYDIVKKPETNRMPATGETTTSPTMSFSESYNGVLVQFKVKRGTIDELRSIGISDGHPLVNSQFGKMPSNQDIGRSWNTSKAGFKGETIDQTHRLDDKPSSIRKHRNGYCHLALPRRREERASQSSKRQLILHEN